jgi:16S rRNA G527 N7-methylase RsmG
MKHLDETMLLVSQKRFLEKLEQGIRLANREVIHKLIPELNQEAFFVFAVAVAKLRASYLEAALRFARASDQATAAMVGELKTKREVFDEARQAFEALQRAIDRGYVDMKSAKPPEAGQAKAG